MKRSKAYSKGAEQIDAEIAADKAREKSLGLTFGSPAGGAMVVDASADQNLGS